VTVRELASIVLVGAGVLFFLSALVGLLRLPDVFTRLHALTKADNLGLGLIVAGLAVQAGSAAVVVRLLLVWLVIMLASATTCSLLARSVPGRHAAEPPGE